MQNVFQGSLFSSDFLTDAITRIPDWSELTVDELIHSKLDCVGCLRASPRHKPRMKRRVGEDVATLTPHGPGRAELLHPVLHERVSLTAA